MIYARQSTAIIVTVGPVLDASGVAVTDGVVGDFKISKNGGAPAALNGSATLTHRNTGHYSLSLTTSDVGTVGTVEIVIDDTVNACPVKEIQVVEEAVYDALFAASAAGYGTAQTGDSFARLGTPAGASVSADIAAVNAKTTNLPSDPADQSLVIAATDALATLIGDVPTNTELATAFSDLQTHGDSEWSTATGFSTHSAADVWASGTRTLSAFGFSVTVGTNNDKTGYGLAADGLDSITATDPGGVASTFPQMMVQLWRRMFKKSTLTSTQLKTYADDGTTVVTTQTVSDDGTTQTQGAAS